MNNIPCDTCKIFLLALNLLTLTLILNFKRKLTLAITFKKKILENPYCRWSFPVTRSLYWYQYICPCDLGHLIRAICFSQTYIVSFLQRKLYKNHIEPSSTTLKFF